MTESFSPQQQLKAFINAAQYLAGLTSGQDIWQEAGKLLVRFFGADVAAFGERRGDGGIEIGHQAFSERGREARLPEPAMITAMGDVFESGFLTFLSSPAAEPVAAGFFPILHENRVIAVMLVGHLSADPLAKETLDLYLAAAGLIGATFSRKISETAVLKAKEELEQRVVERTAQLTAANQELESFAYSVSHDLRAPLRAISGFARILEEDQAETLDDEGKRLLAVIGENTLRMGQLIDDLLAFSRLGRREMRRTVVPMGQLAEEVFEELKRAEGERPLRFTLAPLPPAEGDPALVRQVLSNLLANSIKYARPREVAEIEMGCRCGEENVYFVRDNGVGFDMKYAGKLFGVFQRLHGMDEFEGTGVGLAIMQRIILRHGGRVWGEGEKNAGATFYFTLPPCAAPDGDEGA